MGGLAAYLDLVKGNVDKLGEKSFGNVEKIGGLLEKGLESGVIGGLVGQVLKGLGGTKERMAGERMGVDRDQVVAFADEDRPNRRQMMIRLIGGDDDRPLLDQFFREQDQRRLFSPSIEEIG